MRTFSSCLTHSRMLASPSSANLCYGFRLACSLCRVSCSVVEQTVIFVLLTESFIGGIKACSPWLQHHRKYVNMRMTRRGIAACAVEPSFNFSPALLSPALRPNKCGQPFPTISGLANVQCLHVEPLAAGVCRSITRLVIRRSFYDHSPTRRAGVIGVFVSICAMP